MQDTSTERNGILAGKWGEREVGAIEGKTNSGSIRSAQNLIHTQKRGTSRSKAHATQQILHIADGFQLKNKSRNQFTETRCTQLHAQLKIPIAAIADAAHTTAAVTAVFSAAVGAG